MTAEDKAKLVMAGYDVDGALARFVNNDVLYMTFLKKIPGDEHIDQIKPFIDEGQFDEAHKAAHAIKGIVGNLGITPFYKASTELCNALKAHNADGIEDLYDDFITEYEVACEIINSLQ